MKYKKFKIKPIYNYIPEDISAENVSQDFYKSSTNTSSSKEESKLNKEKKEDQIKLSFPFKKEKIEILHKESIETKIQKNNLSESVKETKEVIPIKENTNTSIKNQKKSSKVSSQNSILNNTNYTKILKETDELIKKLKGISNLEKEKTKGFLISPQINFSQASNNIVSKDKKNKIADFPTLNKSKESNITQTLFKLLNNQNNASTFKFFLKHNKGILALDLFLIFVFIFIIIKLTKFLFKKPSLPEELLYITIKDPFEEAVEKTKFLPKIGTIIVKTQDDIPSSVCILGDLVVIGKVKLPEYVYVKGDVKFENYVEVDTLISEKNITFLKGGYIKTLLASRKIINLSKDVISKGIVFGEQIRTYDFKDYDFELPISSIKRTVLEHEGNFKVPEEITLAQDLIIYGNLEILPFAKILGDIKVYGNVKIWNNVKISGSVFASGSIKILENSIIGKDIISAKRIEIYPGCRLNIFSGRIATYKDIILHKDVGIYGAVISPFKVK